MEDLKKYLEKRIKHAEKRLKEVTESHGDNPEQTHNYFGGQNQGYWRGLLTGYQNVLDKLEGDIKHDDKEA